MKLIEKLAREHAEKATHPEGNPLLRRVVQVTYEAGFRKAREMAAERSRKTCHPGCEGEKSFEALGEEEAD